MGEEVIIEKQLISDIQVEHGLTQEDAMDFIISLLDKE